MTGLRFARIQAKALSSGLQTPALAIMPLTQLPISAGKLPCVECMQDRQGTHAMLSLLFQT